MRFNKKIVIPVLVAFVIIIIIVHVVISSNKKFYIPISFQFDTDTKEIVFTIDDGYKIRRIQVVGEKIPTPGYDDNTSKVSIPAWKLDVNEFEFVYFIIQNNSGKVTEQYNIEYEIDHKSNKEFIITVRAGNYPMWKVDLYTYYYNTEVETPTIVPWIG